MTNKTITLTLDLEDWAYDFKVKHGFRKIEPNKEEALLTAVERFSQLTDNQVSRSSCIVFVTGNVIENYPNVMKLLQEYGFTIGCHCYYHLSVRKRRVDELSNDIQRFFDVAHRNSIKVAPIFRAPMFSITDRDTEHLSLIFGYFKVESGVISQNAFTEGKHLPVTAKNLGLFTFKLGGSYLNWAPKVMVRLIAFLLRDEDNIHIYLHPYELVSQPDFALSFSELREKFNVIMSVYYFLRQRQWNNSNGFWMREKVEILRRRRKIYAKKYFEGSND